MEGGVTTTVVVAASDGCRRFVPWTAAASVVARADDDRGGAVALVSTVNLGRGSLDMLDMGAVAIVVGGGNDDGIDGIGPSTTFPPPPSGGSMLLLCAARCLLRARAARAAGVSRLPPAPDMGSDVSICRCVSVSECVRVFVHSFPYYRSDKGGELAQSK